MVELKKHWKLGNNHTCLGTCLQPSDSYGLLGKKATNQGLNQSGFWQLLCETGHRMVHSAGLKTTL